jgi:hypothetical protein
VAESRDDAYYRRIGRAKYEVALAHARKLLAVYPSARRASISAVDAQVKFVAWDHDGERVAFGIGQQHDGSVDEGVDSDCSEEGVSAWTVTKVVSTLVMIAGASYPIWAAPAQHAWALFVSGFCLAGLLRGGSRG